MPVRRSILSAAFACAAAVALSPAPSRAASSRAAAPGAPAAGAAESPSRPPLAAVPLSRDLPWWIDRHREKLAELHSRKIELLWLGDSITQDWEHDGPQPWNDFRPVWNRFYGDRDAINLGFKGDATSHLLWRIENGEVAGIAPKAAIVLIGANNFGNLHWGATPTLAGIEAILAQLRQRLPATKILLLGVLPSQRSPWVTEQTEALNAALARRDWRGTNVTFMDLAPLFMKDGRLDTTMFLDPLLPHPDPPLHPTAQAQERMAAAIEPTVAAMMGDRSHLSR